MSPVLQIRETSHGKNQYLAQDCRTGVTDVSKPVLSDEAS